MVPFSYNLYGRSQKGVSSTTSILTITVNVLKFLELSRLVIRAGIYKMPVRIANREDPDQTAPSEAV